MSGFLTDLDVEEVDDTSASGRGTWRVTAPLVYQSDVAGKTITVPVGFLTDFASVPRLPFIWLVAGDCGHEAAVVHDWLYASHEVDRKMADLVFGEALEVSGQPTWRAMLMWLGVRVGGSCPYASGPARQART